MLCPTRNRLQMPDGRMNVVTLSMKGYYVYVKVDKRPPPESFAAPMLKPNAPLYVLLFDYDNSPQKGLALDVFKRHFEKKRSRTTGGSLPVPGEHRRVSRIVW